MTTLTADAVGVQDGFGESVSIDGDTVIVGAPSDDDNGANSGSAYVFQRDVGGPDNWGQVIRLAASDPGAGDGFGFNVSISGDTAIVGATQDDDYGADSGRRSSLRRFRRFSSMCWKSDRRERWRAL